MAGENGVCDKFPYSQPTAVMCETTCMKNILCELSRRHSVGKLNIPLRSLNKMYQYDEFGVQTEVGLQNLNDKIKKLGYNPKRKFGEQSNIELLKNILNNDGCSYPVVSVSPQFFVLARDRIIESTYEVDYSEGGPNFEHAIIIADIEDRITFCDPYENYNRRSSNNVSVSKSLDIPTFLNLWTEIEEPKWVVWVEKAKNTLHKWTS